MKKTHRPEKQFFYIVSEWGLLSVEGVAQDGEEIHWLKVAEKNRRRVRGEAELESVALPK